MNGKSFFKLASLLMAMSSSTVFAETVEIGTAAEFVSAMTDDPAGDYALTADIDLAESEYTSAASFSGTLDGRGHVITGLGAQPLFTECLGTVKKLELDCGGVTVSSSYKGMVALTARGATFEDVIVGNVTVKCSSYNPATPNGIFLSVAYDGTSFTRCEIKANATISSNNLNNNTIGGFVGTFANDTTKTGTVLSFTDCTNRAAVVAWSSDGTGGHGHGGFIGLCSIVSSAATDNAEVVFTRCVNIGAVELKLGGAPVGGFVGRYSATHNSGESHLVFVDCLNLGNVTASTASGGNSTVGGFVGSANEESVTRFTGCVNRGNIDLSLGTSGRAGGLMGYFKGYYGGRVYAFVQDSANYGRGSCKTPRKSPRQPSGDVRRGDFRAILRFGALRCRLAAC